MPIEQADIINLARAYSHQGLQERRRRLESLPTPFNQFRDDLGGTLDHIANLVRLDLDFDKKSKPESLVREVFLSYRKAIQDFHKLADETVERYPQARDLFVRTGRYLYDEVEPLLSDDKKSRWSKSLQTLHKSIARVNYPEWICNSPILGTGSRCPGVLVSIVSEPSFQRAFAKRMTIKLKNLLPQIFDSGFSLPRRIELGCERARCQTNFVYDKSTGQRVPNKEFQKRFQAQFVDDMHHIIMDLFESRDQKIDINKALDEGWFKINMTAFSEESREADRKQAQIMKLQLTVHELDNLPKRLKSIGSGVELEIPADFRCNLLLGLFRTIDAELKGWLGDLKEGVLHPDEIKNYALRIKRASLLLDHYIENYSEVEPNFEALLEPYKLINHRIAQFIEPYLSSDRSDTQDLSMDTFERLMAFYRQEGIAPSNDFNVKSMNKQLALLLNYPDSVPQEQERLFESIFANAFHVILWELLVSIDPLDFRGIENIVANIEIDSDDNGDNYPRIVLSCPHVDDSEHYARYFYEKYHYARNTAVEEANKVLQENLSERFALDWNQLEVGELLNLSLDLDLKDFRREKLTAEFSKN